MSIKNPEKHWTAVASKLLVGRKIASVFYMNEQSATDMGWNARPIVLKLDDGTFIYPSMDDEGNDGGALFTTNKDEPVIPVL
jgi:hypothetical protein